MLSTALEAQIYRQLAAMSELTGAVAVTKVLPQGGQTWLFVTLREGKLDAVLEQRICLMFDELIGTAQLMRVFQLSSLPRTHNGRVMKGALSRFINQQALPNRAMMQNPEVLKEITLVTGLGS